MDITFMGTGGRLSIFRESYTFLTSGEDKPAEEMTLKVPYGSAKPHIKNWLDCIRSRKVPNADATEGHYSSMACHIGNMAYKENRLVEWKKEWDV